MPKITKGGVSDVNVDPDFIAPPGTPPADAIDAGQQQEQENDERDGQRAGADAERDGDVSRAKPVKRAAAGTGRRRGNGDSKQR